MGRIEPPFVAKGVGHVYQTYAALVGKRIGRNAVIDALAKEGVQANIGTYASHVQPVYRSRDRCPVSKDIFGRALALPLYYGLAEDEIDAAAKKVRKVLADRT